MKKLEIAALALLGLLFFVWPMPHTVSVRDLLLALNLCLFGYLAWRRGWPRQSFRQLLMPASVLAALTAWMYLAAFFISPETSWSLDEISSQWIRALLTLSAGAVVAIAVKKESALLQKTLFVIFVALMLHVLYVDLEALNIWLHDQNLDRLAGLTEGPDKSNYLTNLLFCFLLTESFSRIIHKKGTLPFGNGILTAALALAVISVIVERTRNGIVTLMLMLLAFGALYLLMQKDRLKKSTLFAAVGATLLITIGGLALVTTLRQSPGMDNLIGTIPIAWDTEHYKGWQDEKKYGLPVLPNGETVDTSLYMRVAWFKQGLLLICDHPLGIGFGRNAYGHGMKAKYGEGAGHSHSGMLDFAIGTGVPGALLWLGFFVSLAVLAYRHIRAASNYAAALLFFLLLDFGVRMFLDSIIRDHMLQQFLFLAGLAAVMMTFEDPEKRKPSA
jgi:O-antigen ligase